MFGSFGAATFLAADLRRNKRKLDHCFDCALHLPATMDYQQLSAEIRTIHDFIGQNVGTISERSFNDLVDAQHAAVAVRINMPSAVWYAVQRFCET